MTSTCQGGITAVGGASFEQASNSAHVSHIPSFGILATMVACSVMRTLAIVITCLLAGSIYLVVQYRHADELRAAAKITERWDDRRGVDRHSTASERAALPALPQRMLQSVCFE